MGFGRRFNCIPCGSMTFQLKKSYSINKKFVTQRILVVTEDLEKRRLWRDVGRLKKQTLGAEERCWGGRKTRGDSGVPNTSLLLLLCPEHQGTRAQAGRDQGLPQAVRTELVGSFTLSLIPTSRSLSLGYTFPSEKPALLGDSSHQRPTQHLQFHLFGGSPP